jgi:hypothetical protein
MGFRGLTDSRDRGEDTASQMPLGAAAPAFVTERIGSQADFRLTAPGGGWWTLR